MNGVSFPTYDKPHISRLLTGLKQVGMPLMQAALEAQGHEGQGSTSAVPDAAVLTALADSSLILVKALSAQLGAREDEMDAWVRWALAGAASQVTAAAFRATGKPLGADEAKRIAEIAIGLQGKFKAQIPADAESLPNTLPAFRAKMLEALVPVVGAIAQYSFGRAEHGLLAEVAERLVKTADQATRALAPSGASAEEWRLLCWHVLKAAGQIYAESHYAEADRLLYMEPEARAAYFAQHGQIVPMTQVWQAFNQRMAMLATLATYLDAPESAKIDAGDWS